MPTLLIFCLQILPALSLGPVLEHRGDPLIYALPLGACGLSSLAAARLNTSALQIVARGCLLPAAWAWLSFLAGDAHQARFGLTFLLVPAAVGIGALHNRGGAGLGAFTALTAIWTMMIPRADNGCTGVGPLYGQALVQHALALILLPWALGRPRR